MAMAKPSSRPKPPEAVAEGQPLRGFGRRLASPAELGGASRRPFPLLPEVAFRAFRSANKTFPSTSEASFFRCSDPREPGRGHKLSFAAAAAFDILDSRGAKGAAFGGFRPPGLCGPAVLSFGRGVVYPPFLIRSEASLCQLRPKACMLVSGGVLGTHNQYA
jgi:hypothetical protein